MKKMMILVCAIMMVATANAKQVETESFNEVRVNVPARVRVVAGDNYSVNIVGSNRTASDAIRVSVENGVLRINARDMEQYSQEDNKLCITIVTPVEPRITTGRHMQATTLRDNFSAAKDMAANN